MKGIQLNWSRVKVNAMVRSRGPIKGVVAVLVSSKLGDEYGTVVSGKSAEAITATIPPSVGIYAAMPSSDPDSIVEHLTSLWDDETLATEPYTVESDGVVFHKGVPDHFLTDIRTWAWRLLAEQNPVEIVEAWGVAPLTTA